MAPFESMAKMLVFAGMILVLIGGLLLLAGKIPGIGKLPGDIFVQRGNFTFYFPVVTSIVLSILLTILLNLFFRR
ncbi:hypothetical protein P378_12575 [Desulforamulus profundi]|uniref:DUF2905 domain-containing protein n=1 Tax=Desulforamulus profundi TaxID=1383067 RepID=A0A2C6MEY0_9FIRM|nr:DUF2905 domain-containing protein [Desulforamulus profundi]MCL5781419.1 DUF2905 domain-containing protein [Bacillota bacterium]PHJ37933.1 hypothetical protein P378_12575 [Desulforamulus profundi]